jgi:AcrR family transcriptional regulator
LKNTRNYHQQARQVGAGLTRSLVLQAALQMLSLSKGVAGFGMESVARAAGVSRMTVFKLFGSKQGLLRAVYQEMAEREHLADATDILNEPDVRMALRRYVAAFAHYYDSHRVALKHLRGFAALDDDFAAVLREREDIRLAGIAYLLRRWHGLSAAQLRGQRAQALVQTLRAMLAFEVFELLAATGQSCDWVATQVENALAAVLDAFGAAQS